MGAVVLCVLCAVGPTVRAQKPGRPTAEDLAAIRDRIDRARQAAAAARILAPASRDLLRRKIDAAASALSRYEQLAKQATRTPQGAGLLFMIGAALIADDASAVGVADDVLLPLVVLALIAERRLRRPIDDARLGRAWNDVVAAMTAVGEAARQVSVAAPRTRRRPPRSNCTENLKRCLDTPLGNRNSGGTLGTSICYDCHDVCRGIGSWPERTSYGADCQWWNHESGR